ncbi:MAG: hypothetical protein ACYTBZ_07065 [Planctomycetota bacterium]
MKLTRQWAIAIAMCTAVLHLPVLGMGCGSFSPLEYFSKNACDFLNCDVLFFVDDMLPLSGGPITDGESGGAPAETEEEGGGHMH